MTSSKTYFIIRPKLRRFVAVILLLALIAIVFTALLYPENPLYLIIDALVGLLMLYVALQVVALSLYTYRITETYIEKSRSLLVWNDVHRVPISKIQSYEVHSGLMNVLTGTTTIVFKHAAQDRPTITLESVGTEYVESVENAIELILNRDIKGPADI